MTVCVAHLFKLNEYYFWEFYKPKFFFSTTMYYPIMIRLKNNIFQKNKFYRSGWVRLKKYESEQPEHFTQFACD